MRAVVVYESIYGNTKAIAEAIADPASRRPRPRSVLPVDRVAARGLGVDLLVVGEGRPTCTG